MISFYCMMHRSVEAALGIIDALEKQGYEFVTVDEVIFE